MALKTPSPISMGNEGKLEEFQKFRVAFENYEIATGLDEKTEKGGKMTGEITLSIDPNIKPVKQKPRGIPVLFKEDLRKELKDLEDRGIIEEVNEPSEWISNIILVKRKSKLKICFNPYHLNQELMREHNQSTTIEEILPHL
ncbi:uncharacterized protein LOC129944425 [Eupeodes corollae]|uniref:uncharacterized protein LOC129944425 n=1 Tax=Eupeodes corollae TaxID=290404 RepID=UPI00249223B5|nr:uncharacterized protein LOC129944425 [Eupeodes corollae]